MPHQSPPVLIEKIASISAGLGTSLVAIMVIITVTAGTGYQDFESLLSYGTVDLYNQRIVQALPVLQRLYPLDTLYVFSYVTMVFAMAQRAEARGFAVLAIAVALATGFLDLIENNHIVAMAHGAARDYPASLAQIQFQTVLTQTKFNLGLLLTLALSFLIPFQTRASIIVRWFIRGLVVVAPLAILTPATTLLYIIMNIVMGGLIAFVYARGSSTSGAPTHDG